MVSVHEGVRRRLTCLAVVIGIALSPAVCRADLMLSTQPGGSVVVGSGAKLTDTAVLSGGANPLGSLTFTLYDPASASVDTETVAVSGNGSYSTPTGYLPFAAGTYQWVVSYSGDANGNPALSSTLGSEHEDVLKASPTLDTSTDLPDAPNLLQDSATLMGGFNPTGKITFTLTVPGGSMVTESVPVAGNSHGLPG